MDTGFYKWLWRFNAVVIAMAAATFLAIAITFLATELSGLFSSKRLEDTIPVEANGADAIESPIDLQMGMIEHPEGSDVLRVALRTGDRYAGSFSKFPSSSTLNVGIIDPASLATRWLFPVDHTLVLQTTDVLRSVRDAAGDESIAAQATLYFVVQEDTDKDGTLSAMDQGDLIVTQVDGSGMKVLTKASGFLQNIMLDGATELLVYSDGSEQKIARLDLQSLSLRGEATAIPKPKQ